MVVYRLFRSQPFEPEVLKIMSAAYTEVCRALGLTERDQAETEAVARKVIEFAQRGVRDTASLREHVLQSLRK